MGIRPGSNRTKTKDTQKTGRPDTGAAGRAGGRHLYKHRHLTLRRGNTEMGIQTMYDIAEALGVPPSELIPDRLLHNNDGIHNDNNTYKASGNKSLGQQQAGTADIHSLYSQLDGPNKKMIDEMISLMLFKQKHTERLA